LESQRKGRSATIHLVCQINQGILTGLIIAGVISHAGFQRHVVLWAGGEHIGDVVISHELVHNPLDTGLVIAIIIAGPVW